MSDHRSILYWIPRGLGIAFALFLTLFTFDAWEAAGSFWEGLLAWIIHLLPVFIVLFVLVVAWTRPRIGGILFLLLGAGFAVFFGDRWNGEWMDSLISFLIVSGPLFLLSFLFLMEARKAPPEIGMQA